VDSLFAREIRPDGPGCAVGVYRNGSTGALAGFTISTAGEDSVRGLRFRQVAR
jgi:hypothetical protein